MAEYQASWQALSFHDLRSIATYLRQEPSATVTKADLIATIAGYWHHADNQAQQVAQLSPAAQRALWWLCHTPALPAQPFWYEFGAVRRARDRQRDQPSPWQQPATAAEELFYCGLLHPHQALSPATGATAPALDRTTQLTLPAPLRHQLAGLVTAAQPLPQVDDDLPFFSPTAGATPQMLVHDLGQYLIYLHQIRIQQPHPLKLLHNRWLSPRHLPVVAARLAWPQARYALRSHKSNAWLALLAFLATVAGLHDAGQLTAQGWSWLAQPPSTQLALLWQRWQGTDWDVRAAYAQPDAPFPLPWPTLLAAAPATLPSPFTPADLAATLLSSERVIVTYWNVYLETLQDLVDRLAALCATLLMPLGIIAPTDPPDATAPPAPPPPAPFPGHVGYTLTPLGRELARAGMATDVPAISPAIAPSTLPGAPVQLTADDPHSHITITFPSPAPDFPTPNPLHAQAVIAGYADYAGQAAGVHCYVLTAATLARAAAAELGLARLAAALQAVAIPLTPPLWQALQAGYGQGQQLQLQPATLLRTSDAGQLAALHGQRAMAALFAEILTPTTALLAVDPTTALATLHQHGYFAQSPFAPPPTQVPDPVAAPAPPAPPTVPTSAVELSRSERELLWLAGQLYGLLAAHLPLPVPPSTQPLQALYATLPATTQATLAAQRQVMAEQLSSLLDNLPFTPPLEPSDPDNWIPIIDAALEQKQPLQMRYFSAGRNLTTHRRVEPYWREEHRGIAYLRAYCHSAGRVLTFRLDRVEALAIVAREA